MSFDYFAALPSETKHSLTISEVEELVNQFKRFDKGTGAVSSKEIVSLADALGTKYGDTKSFLEGLNAFKGNETMSFSDFVKAYSTVHSGKKVMKVKGKDEDTVHTISEEEKRGYVNYINGSLKDDVGLRTVIPLDPNTMDIFTKVGDGNILGKLINRGFPGTVELNNITAPNPWQKLENCQKVIAGSQKLGCQTVNIAAEDLARGSPHLILGLIWQIIKKNLLAEVAKLLPGSDDLPPEQLLFRWFNSHLARAGSDRIVNNWSSDLVDSENFITLLAQLAPESISEQEKARALKETDRLTRANYVLEFAERLGCGSFVSPKEIVAGNPRLNLAFVAQLFQKYPNMGPSVLETEKQKSQQLSSSLESAQKELEQSKADLQQSREKETEEREKRERMEAEVKRLLLEKEAKEREFEELTQTLRQTREERDREQRKREELENELSRINAELARVTQEHEKLGKENSELQSQLKSEREERERLARKVDDLTQTLEAERKKYEEALSAKEQEISSLNQSLAAEREAREKLRRELDEKIKEFERVTAELNAKIQNLNASLEAERKARADLEAALAKRNKEFDEMQSRLESELAAERQARKLEREQFEKEKHDLLARIAELEARIRQLEAEIASLRSQLEEERTKVSNLKDELREITELLEENRVESDEEKTLLLQRIKDLEEEYEQLQTQTASSIERQKREREMALERAEREKEKALVEAERQRLLQLRKVQGLLSKVQRQGWLYHKEKAILGGATWKKRYFVLQDHFLSFYRDQKAFTKTEPMGLISCEQCRVYEQSPDAKKAESCTLVCRKALLCRWIFRVGLFGNAALSRW
eukprot:TRINITY_DN3015_c0_g1_i1.p1 TRINITY_DN3015_c0_g1~~TRINITY_DN3015_c0_g1_i1.p1  ORF type:complete len:829 (+),score=222.10 TRINITY_DN3015_c0_g1_i1:115-2601(+)